MKYIKLILKVGIGLVGLFLILIIILLKAESYETITKKSENKVVIVEIKKVFGRKISECAINSDGFYHGPAKSWHIFKQTLSSEGNFNNGYWQGCWKDYDRKGQLKMIREWDMGKLSKVLIVLENSFKEVPRNEWPRYLDFKQSKPQRVHK